MVVAKLILSVAGVIVAARLVVSSGLNIALIMGVPPILIGAKIIAIGTSLPEFSVDPRFPPVSYNELNSIVFEVSILTPPQLVKVKKPTEYPSKIEVGKDGLIVEGGYQKGLLLPQVPIEWNWNEEEFLCQCCMKAGLSPDCWVVEGTKIYKFSCVIAQELTPKGEVAVKDLREE